MANYTPTFTKPYPSGWVDKPSKTTPATAAIMNSYDTAIAALEAYLRDNAIKNVTASTAINSGTKTATITIDGTEYVLYSPSVSYESAITGGTKVGTITVGTNTFDVYAPTSSAGGSTVSVVPKTLTGTNIAEITVDGTTYQLYAPTSGGSGSTVTAEATLTEGTQIGKITIDGVETILYAPTESTITVDAELSATSENAIQNKAVDAAVKNLQHQIDAGGTGGSVTVDSALSTTSENPVQNKVVTAELNKKIETLDDESQAPDVVNFDLDSELSLTSVKGVQNKAIAEEFQKYANGTKVVAKATEANTATTASNAEKANGHTVGTDVPSNAVFTDTVYDDSTVKTSIQNIVNGTTQVGNATKATQDAQGNVINETYAKKTEVPQGTVVDDALSSTSTNPVQNKVVKAEFDKVNSNLSALGKCKNLLKPTLQTTTQRDVTCTNNGDGTYTLNGTADVDRFFFIQTITDLAKRTTNKDYKLIGCPANGANSKYDLRYEINGSVNNGGNKDFGNGCIVKNNKVNSADITSASIIISIMKGFTANNLVFKPMLTTNLNATYDDFVPYTGNGDTLTHDVAKIKNDLSNLKDGTTPVAKAVADEDGNNIKSTYAKKTEVVAVEDVEVTFDSSVFSDFSYSCKCIGKMCFLYFNAKFGKNGILSDTTNIIDIKEYKYEARTDIYAGEHNHDRTLRLFKGVYELSNGEKGELKIRAGSYVQVVGNIENVYDYYYMWGSIQWMIK